MQFQLLGEICNHPLQLDIPRWTTKDKVSTVLDLVGAAERAEALVTGDRAGPIAAGLNGERAAGAEELEAACVWALGLRRYGCGTGLSCWGAITRTKRSVRSAHANPLPAAQRVRVGGRQ